MLTINIMLSIIEKSFNLTFNSGLMFHEIWHGLIAIPFAIFLFKKTKSKALVLLLFLITYFLDLDHLIDYFMFYGLKFSLLQFLSLENFKITGRATVFLHGWEYVLFFGYLAYQKGKKKMWKTIYMVIVLAMLPHLIWDTINVGDPLFYSLIIRIVRGYVIPAGVV